MSAPTATRRPWAAPFVAPLRTSVDAAYDLSPLNLSRLLDGLIDVMPPALVRGCAAAFADNSARLRDCAASNPHLDPASSRRGVDAYADLAERVTEMAMAARPEVAAAMNRLRERAG